MIAKHQTILIDPPWPYRLRKGDSSHRGEVTRHYSEMSEADILALPVDDFADPSGCAVWMWITNNHLPLGFRCFEEWGVTYKTLWTWLKTTNDGSKPRIGIGHWGRSCTEHLMLGTVGKLSSFCHTGTLGGQPNLVMAPRREHSRKPSEVYEIIERLQPNASARLEIFARHSRNGWRQWGNETDKFEVA